MKCGAQLYVGTRLEFCQGRPDPVYATAVGMSMPQAIPWKTTLPIGLSREGERGAGRGEKKG